MKKPIRVLLADDHPVVRQGIRTLLQRQPKLQIVAEAQDGKEALALAKQLLPDVLLMDIDMPEIDGLTLADTLAKELPEVKVLILSMHATPEYVKRIIQSGARGYVLKDAPPEDLVKAIESVLEGNAFFSPEVARVALNHLVQGAAGDPTNDGALSARERDVLILIAEGLTNKEIAINLNLGVRTVETHRERVMRKLNIHSVAGLTKYAISKGWVQVTAHES